MQLKKTVLASIVALTLVIGLAGGVAASSVVKEIKALLDPSISIVYNNEPVKMKDGAGNPVYPILYNGSTYIPVRAVSEIFGQAVEWDGSTKTVYLGARSGEPIDVARAMKSGNQYCWRIAEKSELTVEGDTGYATFSSGIQYNIWNSTASVAEWALVSVDVSGKTTLTFTAWSDISAVMHILDEKGGVITSFKHQAGTLSEKEIDITGYSKIAFAADAQNAATKGNAKFFDPIAK